MLCGDNICVCDLDLPVNHGVADHHNEGGQQILEQQAGVHIRQARRPNWPALMMSKM